VKLALIRARINNKPASSKIKECAIEKFTCKALRDTYVFPCQCLVVCNLHAKRLDLMIPSNICPLCGQGPLNGNY
jgi:hypothetical protein